MPAFGQLLGRNCAGVIAGILLTPFRWGEFIQQYLADVLENKRTVKVEDYRNAASISHMRRRGHYGCKITLV